MDNYILTFQKVTKSFSGVRALDNVDFAIERGQIHGLIGPNGSGKTTVLNVTTGIFPADKGKITFNSKEITGLKSPNISKLGISRTFQGGLVIPTLTCLDNVITGAYSRTRTDLLGTFLRPPFKASTQELLMKSKGRDLLRLVGLNEHADHWASELVWIERQLLQVARALAAEPELLLLDEPTSGMGHQESDQVKEIIGRVRDMGITIILVSHDVKLVAELSDRITVISSGEKICEGTPEQVQRDPLVMEAYLGTD